MVTSSLHHPMLNSSSQQDFLSRDHQVARRSGLSYEEFARDYLWPCRPVILSDAIEAWPANGKWTMDFFKTRYATKEVTIDGKTYQVGKLIDLIHASTAENIRFHCWLQLLAYTAVVFRDSKRSRRNCSYSPWIGKA